MPGEPKHSKGAQQRLASDLAAGRGAPRALVLDFETPRSFKAAMAQ